VALTQTQTKADRASITPDSKGVDEVGLMWRAMQTHLRPIYDDNERTVARAAIAPSVFRLHETWLGVLCVGGLRAEALSDSIVGIMLGEPQRASRGGAIVKCCG
jgi:hypothetical protein